MTKILNFVFLILLISLKSEAQKNSDSTEKLLVGSYSMEVTGFTIGSKTYAGYTYYIKLEKNSNAIGEGGKHDDKGIWKYNSSTKDLIISWNSDLGTERFKIRFDKNRNIVGLSDFSNQLYPRIDMNTNNIPGHSESKASFRYFIPSQEQKLKNEKVLFPISLGDGDSLKGFNPIIWSNVIGQIQSVLNISVTNIVDNSTINAIKVFMNDPIKKTFIKNPLDDRDITLINDEITPSITVNLYNTIIAAHDSILHYNSKANSRDRIY